MLPSLRGASAALLGASLTWSLPSYAAKIACVGDSITFGYGLSNPSTESYPSVLGVQLGSAHTVQNFGVSGATLMKMGDKPYWNESAYTSSRSFEPDVVVIMLGTNDAKPQNWSKEAAFAPDYSELIDGYRSLGALVYVATPPPVYPPGEFDIAPDVIENEVVPAVRAVALDEGAPLIDVFSALSGQSARFPDTVHPDAAGAALIAETVQAALEANGFGGAAPSAGAGGMSQGGRANAGQGGVTAGGGQGGELGGMTNGGAGSANGGAGSASSGESGVGGARAGAGGAPMSASGSGGAANGAASGAAGLGSGGVSGRGGGSLGVGGAGAGVSSGGAGMTGAGAMGNAGAAPKEASESGCGCRVTGSAPGFGWAGSALVALALALGRRVARRLGRTD